MKAFFLKGLKNAQVNEVPIPNIERGDILVKMKVCGICGTDVEKILGEAATPPILGHEVSGEIVDVGRGVEKFRVGDHIFVHHHVSCGTCYYCLHGSTTMCKLFTETNIEPGGFSEFFRVPRRNVDRGAVIKLPPEVGFENATFIEPLACCLRSLDRCGVKPGLSVAVVGCGPMGLLLLKCLKVFGASIIIGIDLLDYRLAFAKAMGIEAVINPNKLDTVEAVKNVTEGMGVDLAILATGSIEGFRQAFFLVRKGGIINLFGAPCKSAHTSLGLDRVFYDEVSIIPSYSTTEVETNTALSLIKSRRIDVMELVTHRFDLSRVTDAFKTAMEGESLKVLVTSSHS